MLRDSFRDDDLLAGIARNTHAVSIPPRLLSALISPRPFAAWASIMTPVQLVVRRYRAHNLLVPEALQTVAIIVLAGFAVCGTADGARHGVAILADDGGIVAGLEALADL